jgi:putative hydrolase of the HAD superfamily
MVKVVLFDYGGVLSRLLVPQYKVRRLAKTLLAGDIKVAVLSNMNPFGGWCIRTLGLYRGFEPVILSYQEGVRKPDPRIYQIAIKKLGVKPGEILFIDNLSQNLVPAKAAGLQVLHADGTKKLMPAIKEILKKENQLEI